MMNLPNTLSVFRLLSVPVLLALAWFHYEIPFLVLLVFALLSDGLDGYFARRFDKITELGAKLDTWADVSIYVTLGISALWLWPEAVYSERYYFGAMIASIVFPTVVGLLKFNTLTSYHTWLVKLASAAAVVTAILLVTGVVDWPFRIAAVLTVFAALEEVAITAIIDRPMSNVRSLWHVMNHKV